jgi:hypothetical protein
MRPAFLDEMSWEMAEVYGAVTDRILINIARHFPYIHLGGEPLDLFNYQVRKLAEMGQVNSETIVIITKSLEGADEALQGCLEAAIVDALKPVEPTLRKAAEQGLLYGPGVIPPTVAPNQMQAFKSFYAQSADKMNLVNTVMLESTQAAYTATVSDVVNRIQHTQSILNVGTGEVVTGVSSWNTAMHDAVKKDGAERPNGFCGSRRAPLDAGSVCGDGHSDYDVQYCPGGGQRAGAGIRLRHVPGEQPQRRAAPVLPLAGKSDFPQRMAWHRGGSGRKQDHRAQRR